MESSEHPYPLAQLQEGILLLFDKPLNWTSFDVVNRVRVAICKYYGIKKIKIGHAGTLDPLATGLLAICSGKWTRKIDAIQNDVKRYSGIIKLGAVTASYDLETTPEGDFPTGHITQELIDAVAIKMTGLQLQVPPVFSAIKKDGKRAYDLARAGKEVTMAPRKITIHELHLTRLSELELAFEVTCSKGTYIRSLANDIGCELGSGAYLASLRRTGIGELDVKNAVTIDYFLSFFQKKN